MFWIKMYQKVKSKNLYCNFCGISEVHIRKGTWVHPTFIIELTFLQLVLTQIQFGNTCTPCASLPYPMLTQRPTTTAQQP